MALQISLTPVSYTPEKQLAKGKQDPAFRTKLQIALELVERAQAAGIAFCAIVAHCFYGDNNALETALLKRRLPCVLTRRSALGRDCAPAQADHSFKKAAQALPLCAWHEVARSRADLANKLGISRRSLYCKLKALK